MGSLDKLENSLDEVLDKKAPFKMPEEARKSIAGALWWIALIVGVLQLWMSYEFWSWGHKIDQGINSVYGYFGVKSSYNLGFFYYFDLALMAFTALLLLFAVSPLKNMKKSGWNLLFYGSLIEVVMAVVRLFVPEGLGGGFGSFIGPVLGAVVGAYILFQVRGRFMMSKTSTHAVPPAPKK